ncbi:maleylpyruvate isomerase family mycothiol-dependent enzyme [Nocardiopsis suaedae]|uniref:Maleylpyruvate isomerase family mycothiol-dependent enzyme n=1 Tax=Nocardiopsis suaedae TaxID=3018444 RepID=A0ABT4TUK7_9ACTN|nr:maleylpyruvate isomerase family mycothiol-dependent enzyme [Nocardiopsis suaedae]MDA2808363.1 maleylpyruvate isomerase family mycothiol-dependent enzyme [Nocardiopsis suaedae]
MPPAPLSDDRSSPAFLLSSTHHRARRLLSVLDTLDDAAARDASALPGWTRGHVAAHLSGVARALARQARYAAEGRLVEVYDGGRDGRDAAIEAGADRSAAGLRTDVAEAVTEIEAAWPGAEGPGWELPVRHRDGTVLTALQCWWRELVLHTDDLRMPGGPRDWEPEFYVHLTEFLAPRAPEGVRLLLSPVDGAPQRMLGEGRTVVLSGAFSDLAAFLAGRAPEGVVAADTGESMDLRPWP